MRAWTLADFGFDNLDLREVDTPTPGPNDLLVQVSAVSLNYRDKALVEGDYSPEKMPKGLIVGADSAGVVTAVGSDVTKWEVGDRVTSHFYSTWADGPWDQVHTDAMIGGPIDGGLAEYVLLHEDRVVKSPVNLSDAEAATLPIAALTAWFSLVHHGGLEAGGSVLVQGTGGVSVFAIQIASALGARVIATSSSDEKLAVAKDLGATDLINYRTTPDWAAEVLRLTDGKGVDVVIDVAGGDGVNDSVRAAKAGGVVAVIGFLAGQTANLDLMTVLFRQTTVQGVAVGTLSAFEELVEFLEQHGISPVIDSTYRFEDAKARTPVSPRAPSARSSSGSADLSGCPALPVRSSPRKEAPNGSSTDRRRTLRRGSSLPADPRSHRRPDPTEHRVAARLG
ncbi:zinc-dependent alcohol dehydrogenase family protein [Rathayibacter sp. VKM Ac-2630]|uniref:zinc-dependent alcohol dehydrogenase family protein n=1 Tax=Rathayibacter sp. VKM Ac-2630 TaxID=1938617 RepID=UPI00191BDB3E|nr:NAD(P)-dependent alcohol dehydrogenase [Rathayibacter sp. VKM Ac-2630]